MGGQDCQDSRPVYFRESHVQLRTMLLIPRSAAAWRAVRRRRLLLSVVALLCFGGGGCSVALHLSPFASFAFHSAPLAKLGTRQQAAAAFLSKRAGGG